MKKCGLDKQGIGGAEHHSSGVTLRKASQSSLNDVHDDDGNSLENMDFLSCMLPYDEEIAETKKSVERILGEVNAEYHQPLSLETDLQRFEEPLLRLRTFLDNNRDPPNSSTPAVNGPCKDPIQAMRAFLDR
ncbi:uncharacterized protein LOC106868911 [Octopus bimaculoides]|uniref:Uncharacterized protein n=1 Tax=Octopus bimaculoides TaxID=37653 RepID=A0A0L8HTH2_OCTBM|nr:uncharacterized protein LOC106868911 [Octopus bimaculoides]XP_052833203.1 uncharacterized protein LOC106868911 [Octopus bimaculoides]XP_052833204.1 uncharacterized protein LOC106868911 [Octopus bimaculoides]|eukprot:XP_014769857.1 PREDICTED: uncharacterized protein LOC106868911 [Octopus bimaculoides]